MAIHMRNVVQRLDEDLRFGRITSEEYGAELYKVAVEKMREMTRSFSVVILSDRDHCGGQDDATIEEVRELVKCELCAQGGKHEKFGGECPSSRFMLHLEKYGHAVMSDREKIGDWFDCQNTTVVYTNPRD